MKTSKGLMLIILLFVVATVTECTVQKRNYRKGYYVSIRKKPTRVISNKSKTKSPVLAVKNVEFVVQHKNATTTEQPKVVFSVHADTKFLDDKLKIIPLSMLTDSCGDVVVMKDGTEMTVKITEVGSKTIRYKRCDNLSGPTIVVRTESVFMIKYASGTKEVFKTSEPDYVVSSEEWQSQKTKPIVYEAKKVNGFALASFVVSLLSWTLVLAPVSLIFGFIGISQATNHPEKYVGKGFAVAGVVITLAVLFIFLLAVL